MKALLCHNYYRNPGGEDQVFSDEANLLESRGCEVVRYVRHSDETEEMSSLETLRQAFWSRQSYNDVREVLQAEQPDVMHCTNLFPLISPAAHDAAREQGVPVVQSLHNFRLLCSNALCMRDGEPCKVCLGKTIAWPGVLHGCYRNSRIASAAMAGLIAYQHRRRRNDDPVDCYIALSEFSRERFIEAGFPADRVVVKPNFVAPDPGPGTGDGEYVLFVGRLSEEKGLDVLIDAWSSSNSMPPLKIVGDGPLAPEVLEADQDNRAISWLGRLPIDDIYQLLQDASCLVLPSRCYENCPKTILEAYSCGTPVIASRLGSLREYVDEGVTGESFEPGNAEHLRETVRLLHESDEQLWLMRHAARRVYEEHYSAEVNFRRLAKIYAHVIGRPAKELFPTPDETALSPPPEQEPVHSREPTVIADTS